MSNCAVCGKPVKSVVVLHRECFELLHKTQQLDNEPLTLEELRGMDGEPVWIQTLGQHIVSRWRIIRYSTDAGLHVEDAICNNTYYGWDTYGLFWLAYRRKPSELDHPREITQPHPMTNADRIRAMSDEELAVMFAKLRVGDLSVLDMPVQAYSGREVNDNLDWLKQPAVVEI